MSDRTDGGVPEAADTAVAGEDRPGRFDGVSARKVGLALVPLVLLGVAVGLLLVFPPFAGLAGGEALSQVDVSHVTLPDDGTVVLHVTNSGAESVTIEQVLVDDAYWNFEVAGGPTLSPLESSTVEIPYHWTPGWDLETALVLGDGATFHETITAPQPKPAVDGSVLWSLAIVGLFVGVIPVALGMLWFGALGDLPRRWLHGVLAFSIGVLTFLAFDTVLEALEVAESIPAAFDGRLLVVVGALGTLLLVQAVSSYLSDGGNPSPLALAYLVALGIGLHNLAEGLAIGSAFALGQASLGAFLVVGFMVHNVTEGPAVVAPVADGERPSLWHFGLLGLLAGAPVILGGWIGSVAYSPLLGALFLAAGVGAILQVDWEIASMIRREGRLATPLTLGGFLLGLLVMYATDLLVAL